MNKCDKCGREYSVDLMLPQDIWAPIKPCADKERGGFLCGHCVVDAFEAGEIAVFGVYPMVTKAGEEYVGQGAIYDLVK